MTKLMVHEIMNDKIVDGFMRQHYIIPASQVQKIHPMGGICVGSVRGEGFHYGGGSSGSGSAEKPF